MKKFLAPIIASLSYLMLAPSAFAALIDCTKIDPPFNAICSMGTTSISTFIGAAISFIFVIAVIIAIFFLLFGAVKWIYSGGDKAAVEGARNTITAAVIGLIILFLVFLIFTVVLKFFGIDIVSIELPSILD